MPATPFFPALRARLATLGRNTTLALRQLDFLPLREKLRELLPVHLLASADEGPGCRERIFSLRLTFEGFIWQVLKPGTSCQEVVRAVQALFHGHDLGAVSEENSGFIQARQRLPVERLERALLATARTAAQRVSAQGTINGRTVLVADNSPSNCPTPTPTGKSIPKPPAKSPAVVFRC